MALGLLARLLMTKRLKFEEGLISLKDMHMTLVPASFIGELTHYFYKEERLPLFYLISWIWGFILVDTIKREFKLKTPDKVYSLGMDLGEVMGIGLYKTHDYHPGRYTHFVISNNPYIKYIKWLKVEKPLDYFISGCMAGGGCHVHGTICQNVETKCILVGDPYCDFLTGTEEELKNRNLWEEASRRYSLDKIYPIQKRFYREYSKGKEAELVDEVMKEIESI